MATLDSVKQTFIDAGNQLKADLWQPGDLPELEARAQDLIDYDAKAAIETDPAKVEQYKAAAADVVDNVKLRALLRVQVLENDLRDQLEKAFMNYVLPALGQLLKAIF